jgi:hypothetical protein
MGWLKVEKPKPYPFERVLTDGPVGATIRLILLKSAAALIVSYVIAVVVLSCFGKDN